MTTHPDFNTLVPGVDTIDAMEDHLCPSLEYQYMFVRKTSPWERSEWRDEDLDGFNLNLEEVDRLYYIFQDNYDVNDQFFNILARVCHGGSHLFVELSASCDYTGFDCQGCGDIFVTRSANIFFQVLMRHNYDRDAIRASLLSDGYALDDLIMPPRPSPFVQSAPMLKFLCHVAINDHKDLLAPGYKEVLPPILKESITEFINVREAMDVYDSD